jgi:hypothetical protein
MFPCCVTCTKDNVSAHTCRAGGETYTRVALARILDILGPLDADLRPEQSTDCAGYGGGPTRSRGYGSVGCWKVYQVCARGWGVRRTACGDVNGTLATLAAARDMLNVLDVRAEAAVRQRHNDRDAGKRVGRRTGAG